MIISYALLLCAVIASAIGAHGAGRIVLICMAVGWTALSAYLVVTDPGRKRRGDTPKTEQRKAAS